MKKNRLGDSFNIYTGTFLIAFSTLAFEITLTRILSVMAWYHLAFFAVAAGLLGMTAGATWVYLRQDYFSEEKLNDRIAGACLWYSVSIPISVIIICLTPLQISRSIMTLFSMLLVTLSASAPFFFSGIVITTIMTKQKLPIGRIYAADLAGASMGCLFVLGCLEVLDAPSLCLLCGGLGALAALFFTKFSASFNHKRHSIAALSILTVLAIINSSTKYGIRPFVMNGKVVDMGEYEREDWNSYSMVMVSPLKESYPMYWDASVTAPMPIINQHFVVIDGKAETTMRGFKTLEDIDHLRYDITNIVHYVRPDGPICVIGIGGGRDVQGAILFGHRDITGIDLNKILIRHLQGPYKDFVGIADYPGVTLVEDEARSYLSRTSKKYQVIQMSLIDTWAATGAGAFTLSENALYTREAWRIFIDRLTDDGIFTVSRWFDPNNPGETGRIISLSMAALFDSGVKNPSGHIVMVAAKHCSTLLLSKQPFSPDDLSKIRETVLKLKFNLLIEPETRPEHELLKSIVTAESIEKLEKVLQNRTFNFMPPSDEIPYFFNMLRIGNIGKVSWDDLGKGMLKGNAVANLTLVGLIFSLLVVSIGTVIFPLLLRDEYSGRVSEARIFWPAAVYFSLIGAGFMFTEIALVQKMSVFLGHPVYALGIILFTIILSAGAGSLLSERLPLTKTPWIYIYPVIIAAAIAALRFGLPLLTGAMESSRLLHKNLVSIIVIFPVGFSMGLCFPTGMLLVAHKTDQTPWYWGLNGVFGVLSSSLAVAVSIFFGISMNFFISISCYLLLLFCLPSMRRLSCSKTN